MSTETQTAAQSEPPKMKTKRSKGGGKAKAPLNESAHDKFRRLAPPRVEAALKKISLIGNLAGSGYHYEPSEAKDIIEALKDAVADVEIKFSGKGGGRRGFSFRR